MRRSAARMPRDVATAIASASVENEPNAVTPASSAAAITARAPSARSSGLAAAVPSAQAAAMGSAGPASGRPAQSSSSSTLAVMAAARSTSARIPSGSTRPVLATPTRRPSTNRRLTKTSLLATFWWISLLANRVSAASPATTRASASPAPAACGLPDDLLREAERRLGVAADRVPAAHATTPTRTLRNRAPETPWPTWPAWPGSPLPQFGVPHIRHDEASPTASIDRHSS